MEPEYSPRLSSRTTSSTPPTRFDVPRRPPQPPSSSLENGARIRERQDAHRTLSRPSPSASSRSDHNQPQDDRIIIFGYVEGEYCPRSGCCGHLIRRFKNNDKAKSSPFLGCTRYSDGCTTCVFFEKPHDPVRVGIDEERARSSGWDEQMCRTNEGALSKARRSELCANVGEPLARPGPNKRHRIENNGAKLDPIVVQDGTSPVLRPARRNPAPSSTAAPEIIDLCSPPRSHSVKRERNLADDDYEANDSVARPPAPRPSKKSSSSTGLNRDDAAVAAYGFTGDPTTGYFNLNGIEERKPRGQPSYFVRRWSCKSKSDGCSATCYERVTSKDKTTARPIPGTLTIGKPHSHKIEANPVSNRGVPLGEDDVNEILRHAHDGNNTKLI